MNLQPEDLLEMPNWPQAVIPLLLENLHALASIAGDVAADPVEGPRLAKFVNDADPAWAALVEASKTVKQPQAAPPAAEAESLHSPSSESSPAGTPGATVSETAAFEPAFDPAPGQKFKIVTFAGHTAASLICFRCPKCNDRLDIPIKLQGAISDSRSWLWDGNNEAPTIKPSIRHVTCGWHGYITAGAFDTLPDSNMPAAPAMTKAPVLDTASQAPAQNETLKPETQTSQRPHLRKMAGN